MTGPRAVPVVCPWILPKKCTQQRIKLNSVLGEYPKGIRIAMYQCQDVKSTHYGEWSCVRIGPGCFFDDNPPKFCPGDLSWEKASIFVGYLNAEGELVPRLKAAKVGDEPKSDAILRKIKRMEMLEKKENERKVQLQASAQRMEPAAV